MSGPLWEFSIELTTGQRWTNWIISYSFKYSVSIKHYTLCKLALYNRHTHTSWTRQQYSVSSNRWNFNNSIDNSLWDYCQHWIQIVGFLVRLLSMENSSKIWEKGTYFTPLFQITMEKESDWKECIKFQSDPCS